MCVFQGLEEARHSGKVDEIASIAIEFEFINEPLNVFN